MMKRGLLVAWFWFFGISVFAQEDPVLSIRIGIGLVMQMQNSLRRNMRNFSLNRN